MFIFPIISRQPRIYTSSRAFSRSIPRLLFKQQSNSGVKPSRPDQQPYEPHQLKNGSSGQNATKFSGENEFKSGASDPSSSHAGISTIDSQTAKIGYDPKYDNHKILKRVPRFLRPYTTQFIYAPVSHVTSFLILHELTAIVPLVGVWYALHQYHDVLMSSPLDLPTWALEKGTKVIDEVLKEWDFANYTLSDKTRFISEGAYAYVIVKAMFPLRLAVSLLGMPFFAKWFVLPITRLFSKKKPVVDQLKNPTTAHSVKKVSKPRL